MNYRPPAPTKQERQMWPAALDKYVRYLEAVEIRESTPIEVEPLEWRRTGNLLQTATAHGLFYYVFEDFKIAGPRYTTLIACEVIYSGDDQMVAKSAAQNDLKLRFRYKLVNAPSEADAAINLTGTTYEEKMIHSHAFSAGYEAGQRDAQDWHGRTD